MRGNTARGIDGGAVPKYSLMAPPCHVIRNAQMSYPCLDVTLAQGEGIIVENGCLIGMDGRLEFDTRSKGGVWKALKRSFFSVGSFFVNAVYNDGAAKRKLSVACANIGDLEEVVLRVGQEYIFNPHSIVAYTPNVEVSSRFRFKGLLARSPFYEHAECMHGVGRVWIAAFGSLVKHVVPAGETFKVDHSYFVACDNSVNFDLASFPRTGASVANRFKNVLLSPGYSIFVLRFAGPATVITQTKSLKRCAEAFAPYMPSRAIPRLTAVGGGPDSPRAHA